MFTRIDHIGIAVEDLDAAIALYEQTAGMALVHRETVTEQGVEAVLLDVGENHVELLAPWAPTRRSASSWPSAGRACITLPIRSTDIAQTLTQLSAAGIQLIDQTPRIGIRQSQVAFVNPRSTGGVLTEIVQPAGDH